MHREINRPQSYFQVAPNVASSDFHCAYITDTTGGKKQVSLSVILWIREQVIENNTEKRKLPAVYSP